MAAQSGGSTFADTAAAPLADGRADNYSKEVRQAGKAAGIYGIILCRTENFLTIPPLLKLPYPSCIQLYICAFWKVLESFGHLLPHLETRQKMTV